MDQHRTVRPMTRYRCRASRCDTVWVEQPDGSLVRETPGTGCWGGGDNTITAEDRKIIERHNLLEEITDAPDC